MRKEIIVVIILLLITTTIIFPVTAVSKTMYIKANETQHRVNRYFFRPQLSVRLDRLEYSRFEIIEGKGYSIYSVEYTIKNFGSFYFGWPLIAIYDCNNTIYEFDSWYEPHPFLIFRGGIRSFSHEIKIRADKNVNIDEERVFAGHNIILDIVGYTNPFPNDPKSYVNFAKYWNTRSDYEPTLTHLLVSTPWEYDKRLIEINGKEKYYFKSNGTKNLPDIIKNQRLGWIGELNLYLTGIEEIIEIILSDDNEDFAEESWNHMKPLIEWCENVHKWFNQLLKDNYNSSYLLITLNKLPGILNDNITRLENTSITYYSKVITSVNNLITKVEEMINWISTEPWKKIITIQGKIKGLTGDERVEISCRNIKHLYRDEDDGKIDNVVYFNFTVPSTPLYSEKNYFEAHNCQITINGSKHKKNLQSIEFLSYCFSDGIIHKNFDLDNDKKIQKQTSVDFKISKIKNFL